MGRTAYLIATWNSGLGGLARWRQNVAVVRLRKRQEKLALAVNALQGFASNALANTHDMANLVASIQKEMKEIDKSLEEQAPTAPRR